MLSCNYDVIVVGLMEPVIKAFKEYMLKNLGLHLEPDIWQEANKLPIFLQDLYAFYMISFLGKYCLLAVPKDINAVTPSAIRKHLLNIRDKCGFPCIYLAPVISSHNRQRLVKHGVQFIIPGRQIYLPALGIDWAERSSISQMKQTTSNKQLSPSSQAVIIYAIVAHEKRFIPQKLSEILNYTPMSMTRALNEIEVFGLGKILKKGRERWIHFSEDSNELWNQSLPFFQNPIRKRLWLKLTEEGLNEVKNKGGIAGLSALADISMLSEPSHPIYAMSFHAWKSLQQSQHIQVLPNSDDADIELEIWSYDPLLFGDNGKVDKFSLFLSLKDIEDERLEKALNKMMGEVKW